MPLTDQDLDALAERIATRLRAEADRLIDMKELADRLGLSVRGVSGLVGRNELPMGFLIGGVRRWAWTEVRQFLDSRQTRQRRKGRGRFDRT